MFVLNPHRSVTIRTHIMLMLHYYSDDPYPLYDPAGPIMRFTSPYALCGFVVVWTILFLAIVRYFLYNSQQAWYSNQEKSMLSSVEFRIDNFDKRNLRQLNDLYRELRKIEDQIHSITHAGGSKQGEDAGHQPDKREADNILEPSMVVLVIACNRVDYIKQTLDKLLEYRPSAGIFPIVVSQDCGHEATATAISSYRDKVTHIKHPDLSDPVIPASERKMKNSKAEIGYFKISRHYKWALAQVFEEMDYRYVIIVEDDLLIAPDFYSYFYALRPLLDNDPTVWCVSAWNDNGKDGYINMQENDHLYRTDFFPGLGWMMSRASWLELKPKWPSKFWDDWMREPAQRKDKVCIRPEVSRTKTIGKTGVSTGLYYTQHLQHIVLNNRPVDFPRTNISYLYKDVYDREFVQRVYGLPVSDVESVFAGHVTESEVQVRYSSKKEFEIIAKKLKIMSDFRGGVQRTAYRGIVSFMYKSKRIHLVPPPSFTYQSLP